MQVLGVCGDFVSLIEITCALVRISEGVVAIDEATLVLHGASISLS